MNSKVIFDFDDPMGDSTCVSCGECVQACPTGALMESNLLDEKGINKGKPDREVNSVVSLLWCWMSINLQN